jgi:hypothetical protein
MTQDWNSIEYGYKIVISIIILQIKKLRPRGGKGKARPGNAA